MTDSRNDVSPALRAIPVSELLVQAGLRLTREQAVRRIQAGVLLGEKRNGRWFALLPAERAER